MRGFGLVLWLLASGPFAQAACDHVLTFHVDLDPPSSFRNAKKEMVGMDVDMVKAIARESKCTVKWHTEEMSGARILRSIEEGNFDAIIRTSVTPERHRYAYFSAPYRDEVVGIYALRGTQLVAFTDLADAHKKGLRLIGPASGYYGDEYEAIRESWQASGRMTQYKNPVTATQLLFAKPQRGDIVLVDSDVFFFHVGTPRVGQVFNPSQWLRITPAHIMFSKKTVSEETVKQFDSAIRALAQRGQLHEIEKRYRPEILLQEVARAKQREP